MKLIDLIHARATIKLHANDQVSYRTAYKFARFLKASETQDAFYYEKKKELIEKYGQREENGNLVNSNGGIPIIKEHVQDWINEISDLDRTEVETPDVAFTLDDFSEIKISAEELIALDYFIKEE